MVVLQFEIFGIFANVTSFLLFFILIGAGIGMFSRKLSIAVFGAILVYSHVVLETDVFIFNAIFYLVLFIVAMWGATFVVSGFFDGSGGDVDG